jgi:hypothetical protein
MKKIIISFASIIALIGVLLSISVSAALPPIVEPQYQNVANAKCEIVTENNSATANASITGKIGASVQATVTLYKTKNATTYVVYTETTPQSNVSRTFTLEYPFVPEIGATYRLELYGIVTLNGVSEVIQESDTMVFRDISFQ